MEIPKDWLSLLSPVCDMDFCLAHLVLSDEYYRKFYKEQREKGRYVIMDNSMHELGHPMPPHELLEAVKRIEPSVVIAPDQLKQQRETLKWFFETLEVMPGTQRIGAVIQGVTNAERAEFFMKVHKHCDMLCFPFRENRLEWFEDLVQKIPNYTAWPPRLHLMGVNEFAELGAWRDAFEKFGVPHRRTSVDTGKPIKYGLQGKRFTGNELSLRGAGRLENEKVDSSKILDVFYNILFLRKHL
jgi:hypothetical protein